MPRALANGSELAAPQIVSVPVLFPTGLGGSAMISLPLQSGDDVLLYPRQSERRSRRGVGIGNAPAAG